LGKRGRFAKVSPINTLKKSISKIFSSSQIEPVCFFLLCDAGVWRYLPDKDVDNTFSTACEPKTIVPDGSEALFQ